MSNILMSQEKSPVFDLLSWAYGGWKAWPRSPPILTSPGSPRASGCQFLELCHYKDSRTASHMWTTLLNWVQVHTCKHPNLPTRRTRRDFRSLPSGKSEITDRFHFHILKPGGHDMFISWFDVTILAVSFQCVLWFFFYECWDLILRCLASTLDHGGRAIHFWRLSRVQFPKIIHNSVFEFYFSSSFQVMVMKIGTSSNLLNHLKNLMKTFSTTLSTSS